MPTLRCLFTTAALVATASAQTAILPNIPNTIGGSASSWPWYIESSASWPSARIQIVYDSGLFIDQGINQPITIQNIEWRARARTTRRSWNGGTYNNCVVTVGTAGVDYTAITTDYAANYSGGVLPAPAYSGAVAIPPGTNVANSAGPFFIRVTLTNPFTYDPSTGNDLIIEVATDGSFVANPGPNSDDSYPIDGASATSTGDPLNGRMSRLYNTSDWLSPTGTITSNYGLVVRINNPDPLLQGSVTTIGAGCPNSTGNVATLGGLGGTVPTIGQLMTFEIASAPPSQAMSFAMVGFDDLGGLDLGVIGMPGCLLYSDPLFSIPAPTNAVGVGTAALPIPLDPYSVGLAFYVQGFVTDPGFNLFGAVVSDAARSVCGL